MGEAGPPGQDGREYTLRRQVKENIQAECFLPFMPAVVVSSLVQDFSAVR